MATVSCGSLWKNAYKTDINEGSPHILILMSDLLDQVTGAGMMWGELFCAVRSEKFHKSNG